MSTANITDKKDLSDKDLSRLVISISKALSITSDDRKTCYLAIWKRSNETGKDVIDVIGDLIGDKLSVSEKDKFHSAYRKWKERSVNPDTNALYSPEDKKAISKAKKDKADTDKRNEELKTGIYTVTGTPKELITDLLNRIDNPLHFLDIQKQVTGLVNFHRETIDEMLARQKELRLQNKPEPMLGETPATIPTNKMKDKLERVAISKRKARPDQKNISK